MSENMERRYLKWYNKIGYGSGDVAGNVVYTLTATLAAPYAPSSFSGKP